MQVDKKERKNNLERECQKNLKKILKQIKESLKSNCSQDLAVNLYHFYENHPQTNDYMHLSKLIINLVAKNEYQRQIMDNFVYLMICLQKYTKEKERWCSDKEFFVKLEALQTKFKKKEISEGIQTVRKVIIHDKEKIRTLSEQIRVLSENQNKFIARFQDLSDWSKDTNQKGLREQVELQQKGGRGFTKKVDGEDRLAKIESELNEISMKIDMLAMKYDLGGLSSLDKLNSLQQKLRIVTMTMQSESKRKEEEMEGKFVEKELEFIKEKEKIIQRLEAFEKRRKLSKNKENRAKTKQKQEGKIFTREEYTPKHETKNEVNKQNSPQSQRKNNTSESNSPKIKAQQPVGSTHPSFLSQSGIVTPTEQRSITFIKTKIFQLTKIRPKLSKTLYCSKNKSDKNFHIFFDRIPNILLLVKLKNGIIIGGFSKQQFHPSCVGYNGFIFSVTRRQAFQKVKGSAITYDEEAIVFGKNEIKISYKDMTLFSNFGVYERNFHSYSKDINYFINNGDSRYAEIQAYEIIQVVPE